MKPKFNIRLLGKPEKPDIAVDGVIHHEMACKVMQSLLANEAFLRTISWETVRKFSAATRRAYLSYARWISMELPDDVCLDILRNQCDSVRDGLMAGPVGLVQARRLLSGFDPEEVLQLWKKVSSYEGRQLLAEAMPLVAIPLILPTCKWEGDKKEILEARLAKS